MYKINKSFLAPLKYFLYVWLIFIFFRLMPVITWHDLSFNTFLYLIIMFITIVITYVFSSLFVTNTNKKTFIKNINVKKLKKIYILFLFLSFLSLFLTFLKFYVDMSTYGASCSLAGITEIRYAKMSDTERTSSTISFMATLFSGFGFVFYLISYWYKEYLPIKYYKLGLIFFFIFIFSTLLSGGRNAMFVFIVTILLSKTYKSIFYQKEKENNIKKMILYLLLSLLFLYLSGIVFLDRMELRGRTLISSFEYIEEQYGIQFNPYIINLLNIDGVNIFIFIFLFFYFYLTHSLDQFNVAFMSPTGDFFPYLGAMTFYPIVQLLNKFGFDIITINDILNDIVNPGNYTTLFGPLYFDFSIFGSFIFIVILVNLFVVNYNKYLRKQSFMSYIVIILISITFILSPIYSFLALAVFLPICLAVFTFYIVDKFIKIESYTIRSIN